MVPRAPTRCCTVYVACSRTQMVQHGPTCTHPVQESLTAETEEGFASYRRPQAQRLGSWCTVCIPTIGTGLVTQTKNRRTRLSTTSTSPAFMILVYSCILTVGKSLITQTEEGLAAYRRPKAQRFGSWCTVASFKLARVTRPRRRVSSCRGRACLVSTPTNLLSSRGIVFIPACWLSLTNRKEEGLSSE